MLKYKIHRFLGLLILAYIFIKLDWLQMRETISKANPSWLIMAFLINLPHIGIKSIRWKTLLSTQGHSLKAVNAFLFYLSSVYLGIITPGRLGEFGKALYLKQAGITGLSRGFSSVVVDRLCDLYLLFLLGMVGLIWMVPWTGAELLGWAGIVCAIFCPLVFLNSRWVERTLMLFYSKILSSKIPGSVKDGTENFWRGFKDLLGWNLWIAGLLTVISYGLFFLQCFLIARAFFMSVTFLELIPIMALTNLFTFLPISVSGIGTREAALFFLLTPKGMSIELILAFSMGILIVFFLGGALMGAWAWWLRPLRFKKS